MSHLSCPSCGSVCSDSDAVCPNCGESLSPVAGMPSRDLDAAATAPAPATPEPARPCPSCGAAVPASQRFCGSCGADLNAPSRGAQPQSMRSPSKKKEQRKPAQKSRPPATVTIPRWQLIAAAGVVVIGVIIAIALLDDGRTQSAQGDAAARNNGGPSLEELEQLRKTVEASPSDADAVLKYANSLHDAHLYDQAATQYQRYLARVPDNADAGIDLGVCYFDMKKYEEAIRQMKTVLAKHPDHLLGTFNLGIVYMNAGNPAEAAEWFKKTIALAPQSTAAQNAQRLLGELKNPQQQP